jgi:hypothetical protein
MKIAKLTKKGRAALRDDSAQGLPLLFAEIASRTGTIEADHLVDIAAELLTVYGSPENAVMALRTGQVRLDKIG